MAKHALRALKMGRVLCSCGWNFTETDMDFQMLKIQDRLLDRFLAHKKSKNLEE